MRIFRRLDSYCPQAKHTHLTIGMFDGVHRGHLHLLQKLASPKTVITFSNHPLTILKPGLPIFQICSTEHKLKLLEEAGLEAVILLEFTKAFSEQTPQEFLAEVQHHCPFSLLVLGPDAVLGKNRQGDRHQMHLLAQQYQFSVKYLDFLTEGDQKISSQRIRLLIQSGQLLEAEQLLGRKYSIYTSQIGGLGLGRQIGFPTININVAGLCLPPLGVYAVQLVENGQTWKGAANLGFAPTVRNDRIPTLEVHLLNTPHVINSSGYVEVFFHHYLRPEIHFPDLNALKTQIKLDIDRASLLLSAL